MSWLMQGRAFLRSHVWGWPPSFLVISLGVIVVIFTLSWVPAWVVHQEHPPKEDDKYIRRIFAEHTVGQVFQSDYPVDGVEVLVRAVQPGPVMLIARTESGEELGRYTETVGGVDEWIRIPFDRSLPAGIVHVVLATEPNVTESEAILVRFQIDSDIYEDGAMWVNGEPSYGDIAFRTLERGPWWRQAIAWGQVTDKSATRGAGYIGIALSAALVLMGFEAWCQRSRYGSRLRMGAVVLLVLLAIVIRVPYLSIIEGIFGGDAFNYLSKTQALLHGQDPFTADPRKAPLLSFLLVPGFLTPDPLLWSRWIGILAAASTVGLTPLIARRAGLPWPVALASGLLLAVNPDFIWEAPSGLANPLYSFVIVATIYAYLRADDSREPHQQVRWQWLCGIGLGLITLTRYEGAVIAAVILPALWWRHRSSRRRLFVIAVVAAAIMALPMVSIVWSGQSGIRTPSDLAADDGLDLVTSGEQLQLNIALFERFIQQAWISDDPRPLAYGVMGIGLVTGLIVAGLSWRTHKLTSRLGVLTGIAIITLLCFLVLGKNEAPRTVLIFTPLFLAGVGLVAWVQQRPYQAGVIWLTVLVQIITITLILPKSRYYLQLLPFIAIAITFGFYMLLGAAARTSRPGILRAGTVVFLVMLLATYVYADGRETLAERAEWYNGKAQNVSVMIKAAKWLRGEPGMVGFRPQEEQPAQIYVPRERRADFQQRGSDDTIVAEELAWLRDKNIRYAVSREPGPYWVGAAEHPEVFELRHIFETIHGEDRIVVYYVNQNRLAELTRER